MMRPMSQREKWLATLVFLIVFAGGNYLMFDSFWKKRQQLRRDIEVKQRQLHSMRALIENRAFWEQRDHWLETSQPKLTNVDTAGVELLERIKALAQKHSILLENPAIRSPEVQPTHTSVAIDIETKSPWSPLIAFLHELQTPGQFVALENANLKIDATDPTQLRGRFKIARWYAPQ